MASSTCSSTQNPPKKAPKVTYIDLTSNEASPQQHHATIDTTLALIIPPPIPNMVEPFATPLAPRALIWLPLIFSYILLYSNASCRSFKDIVDRHSKKSIYGQAAKSLEAWIYLPSCGKLLCLKIFFILSLIFKQNILEMSRFGTEPPKSRKSQKKSDSAISSEESPSKKKSAKAKKVAATKHKATKKKAPVKKRANDDDNQEGDDTNDDDEETDSDRTESDIIKIPVLNQSSTEYYEEEEEKIDDEETMDEGEDDEVTKELYDDVNVNFVNRDADMTDVDQVGADKQNVSQGSGFEQVEKDAHVTLTPVLDTQKTDEPVQSSSVSSDFTSKLLNLENHSLADNEIASLMDTTVRHEEPRSQTSSLYTIPVTATPEVTSVFSTTIPPPPPFFNPLLQQATPTLTPTNSEATTSFPSLLDFSSVFKFNDRVANLEKDLVRDKRVDPDSAFHPPYHYILESKKSTLNFLRSPQDVSDFATPVIEKNVTESLEAAVLARSSSQPKSTYEAAASLSEFELTTIFIDKMKKNKSYDKADYKRELYDALMTETKIKTPPLDQTEGQKEGSQARMLSHPEIQGQRKRSLQAPLKLASHSQQKPSGKFAHAESIIQLKDSGVQQDQEFDTGNNDEQPADKEVSKADCQVARAKNSVQSFDELMDTSFDFSAFVLNRINIKDLTQEILVGPAFELLKGTCHSPSELDSSRAISYPSGFLYQQRPGISKRRMEYLPKRKWSGLDKRRARVMVQDINKQLYERRLMRNLEKFVSGREYGNDLRLLEQTI
ncbi:hypothetical protein Tco_1044589 [Tanacetum coccineum]|uniref:Uncharacterized protein n=1 Tax=Tanacetum coccineum TaxID=301880 RepID=A0ABQ5GRE7_9ASTR